MRRYHEMKQLNVECMNSKYSGVYNVRHYAAAYCKCFGAELGDVFVKKLFLRLSPAGSSLKASVLSYFFPSLPVVMKLILLWSI